MSEADYQKILLHLEQATHIVLAQQGQLAEPDIRIRHLLSVTATETKRQLLALQRATHDGGVDLPHHVPRGE